MTVPLFSSRQQLWSPQTIYGSDLVARFRADTGVVLDGSNRVSSWADMTGNGHDLDQPTPGNRPEYFTTGGPNNGPYVASGSAATNWMQHLGTPVTVNTGDWSSYMIGSIQGVTGVVAVVTTTLTTPAGCVAFAWRKNVNDFPQVQQLALSAPTSLTSSTSNYLPALTFVGSLCTMAADGTRSLYVAGDGQTGFFTSSHTGNIGIQLAEGYIFRFGANFYTQLALYELGFIKRTSTAYDAARMRAYIKSTGCNVP